MTLLITPTLLDSYNFAKTAPPSWRARAYTSLVQKIQRTPFEANAEMKKGIDFENAVYRICNRITASGTTEITEDLGSISFRHVLKKCVGGNFQKVIKRTLNIDGMDVLLYNKLDVYFPDKITDIKTTANFKGEYNYLKGWQHKLYTWASGIDLFEYIVVEWQSKESTIIKDVHNIPYKVRDFDTLENEITSGIQEFFQYLHNKGLYDDYFFIFSKNK